MASGRRSEAGRRFERGRPGSPRARLFIALDLPAEARDAIVRWRDRALAGRRELRAVAPEALHLTLCFLGWRFEKDVPVVAQTAFDACAGLTAPLLSAVGIEPVPRRRPRLFALDLADADGRAATVQASVAEALAGARLLEPEARPFWPHVTLARVKRGAGVGAVAVEEPPPASPFEAREVTLYRSTLRPQGALYEPLARTQLERPGPPAAA